jgi:DNA-binding MarR family transcriptional regulator
LSSPELLRLIDVAGVASNVRRPWRRLPIGIMTEQEDKQAEQYAAELLELFYPIHYRGNMAVEDAMRGKLTRKEAAIIWLIRSAGEDGSEMRRKEIVSRLQDWFDVSSPAVTKALRHMARPPLSLVRLVEDAASGREKRVRLTPQGQRFVLGMITRGQDFLQKVVEQLPDQQVRDGIEFLRAGVAAYERVHAEADVNGKGALGKARLPAKLAANLKDEAPAPINAAERLEDEPAQNPRPPA